MAEACYTAWATMKQQVLDGINKSTLKPTNMGNTRTMPSFYSTRAFSASLSDNLIKAGLAKAW